MYSTLVERIRPAHFVPVALQQVKDAKSHADCLSALQHLSMLCSMPRVGSSAFSRASCILCTCFDTWADQDQQAVSAEMHSCDCRLIVNIKHWRYVCVNLGPCKLDPSYRSEYQTFVSWSMHALPYDQQAAEDADKLLPAIDVAGGMCHS